LQKDIRFEGIVPAARAAARHRRSIWPAAAGHGRGGGRPGPSWRSA